MNYIVEDNIDFNTVLMEAICKDDDINVTNRCLISNNPLNEVSITLKCNHQFNYNEIYKEVYKQKKTPNVLEIQKLGSDEIKCPYCRTVQKGLLLYHPDFKKVKNVNWPPHKAYSNNKCKYQKKTGKNKGISCDKPCFVNYCWKHKSHNNEPLPICKGIIKSGKRKGQSCVYVIRDPNNTGEFCKIHAQKKDNK